MACTSPSSSTRAEKPAGETVSAAHGGPARLSLGATEAQAREGRTTSFVLEATPDLVLHAALADARYDGQTLQVRGVDPHGATVWSYPHVQKGSSFDVVLPVFGSAAARAHTTGVYSFQVVAPDRTVVAAGEATFTSSRPASSSAGGAW